MRQLAHRVLPWALIAATMFALWPARWGGMFGFTLVSGTSMLPSRSTGDLVVTMRHRDYALGDVVTVEVPGQPGHYVIHRIVAEDPDGTITTKGDNKDSRDQWQLHRDDVLGRELVRVPRCDLAICLGLGLPTLFFSGLAAIAAGVGVSELIRRGWKQARFELPEFVVPRDPPAVRAASSLAEFADGVALEEVIYAHRFGQLRIFYEPTVDMRSGALDGMAASVVWEHPQLGSVLLDQTFVGEARIVEDLRWSDDELPVRRGNVEDEQARVEPAGAEGEVGGARQQAGPEEIASFVNWVLSTVAADAHEWAAFGRELEVVVPLVAGDLDEPLCDSLPQASADSPLIIRVPDDRLPITRVDDRGCVRKPWTAGTCCSPRRGRSGDGRRRVGSIATSASCRSTWMTSSVLRRTPRAARGKPSSVSGARESSSS